MMQWRNLARSLELLVSASKSNLRGSLFLTLLCVTCCKIGTLFHRTEVAVVNNCGTRIGVLFTLVLSRFCVLNVTISLLLSRSIVTSNKTHIKVPRVYTVSSYVIFYLELFTSM